MITPNIKPTRVQRRRTKGWKMPPDTVYVGRGSRWGNPYYVGDPKQPNPELACGSAKEAVFNYSRSLMPYTHCSGTLDDFYVSQINLEDIRHELRGKNLACWCKLDEICHADFLLEIANG